jgi:hypothetical protein
MQTNTLLQQKKELAGLEKKELVDLCIRLAKYKKENKELLNYLLYDAHDPLQYAEQVKLFLEDDFKTLSGNYYYSTKGLRKILRQITKNIKYAGSKQVEIELLLWFCTNFLNFADTRSSHKPLQGILIRQLDKIIKTIPKLHEDLQFDYQTEFEKLIKDANKEVRWLNKSLYLTP